MKEKWYAENKTEKKSGGSRRMVESVKLGAGELCLDAAREYGLVLEGGGAKGAFQIGAWRALSEAGIRIKGVSGVSVGALNGALICMGDLERAEEIWGNLDYSSVMEGKAGAGGLKEAAAGVGRIIRDRGVDVTPLKKLIHEIVDEEKIRSSPQELFVTTFSLSDLELLKKDVKTMPEGEIEDILMASAYFPAFKQERLGGKYYTDGGGFNNVPIDVLLERGYEDIIVIRIYGPGLDREKWAKIPEGTHVHHIAPREDLGGVLEFDRKRIRKNLALGYLEGCRLLYGLAGRRYYIHAPETEGYYFNRMMSELELLKIYVESVLDPETLKLLDSCRYYTETLFPGLAVRLGLSKDWDYRELYLAVLEELAATVKLSRYYVYRADELSGKICKSLMKTGTIPK